MAKLALNSSFVELQENLTDSSTRTVPRERLIKHIVKFMSEDQILHFSGAHRSIEAKRYGIMKQNYRMFE